MYTLNFILLQFLNADDIDKSLCIMYKHFLNNHHCSFSLMYYDFCDYYLYRYLTNQHELLDKSVGSNIEVL